MFYYNYTQNFSKFSGKPARIALPGNVGGFSRVFGLSWD